MPHIPKYCIQKVSKVFKGHRKPPGCTGRI